MSLDFRAALVYPFQGMNRFNGWLIPASLIILLQIMAISLIYLLKAAFPALSPETGYLLMLPFIVLTNVFLCGFFWHTAHDFQEQGLHAPLPSWAASFKTFFRDGGKLFIYVFVLNLILNLAFGMLFKLSGITPISLAGWLPVAVVTAAFLFLGPALAAPVFLSAQNYDMKTLFNLPMAIRLLKGRYRNGLLAMALGIVVFMIYVGVMWLIMPIPGGVIFLPFLLMPMLVSIWHMLAQGLLSPGETLSPTAV